MLFCSTNKIDFLKRYIYLESERENELGTQAEGEEEAGRPKGGQSRAPYQDPEITTGAEGRGLTN